LSRLTFSVERLRLPERVPLIPLAEAFRKGLPLWPVADDLYLFPDRTLCETCLFRAVGKSSSLRDEEGEHPIVSAIAPLTSGFPTKWAAPLFARSAWASVWQVMRFSLFVLGQADAKIPVFSIRWIGLSPI